METRSSIFARMYHTMLVDDIGRLVIALPLTSHAAHCIGAIGELLNFAGALVLAADLFLRQKKEAEARTLDPWRNGVQSTAYQPLTRASR